MKRLVFSLILGMVLQSFAHGQADKVPPKRTNTIHISTSLPDEDLYKKIGNYLLGAGYTLDRSDATLKSLTTAKRKCPGANCQYIIHASVNNSKVRLSGGLLVPFIDNDFSPIENRGQRTSPFMVSFNALNKVATDLKQETSGELEYSIQQ